jgi:hypothetical protein
LLRRQPENDTYTNRKKTQRVSSGRIMTDLMNHPLLVFAISFLAQWLSARIGLALSRRHRDRETEVRDAFGVIEAAVLTLLALIIGFSFSMAISRYDQRKNYEEAEANAIGTEYVRIDLLPTSQAAKARLLLASYLDQLILFYKTGDAKHLREINARTTQLQSELWTAVVTPAAVHPTPVMTLAVEGMNDVLNSQGYTQAAWWNRIPVAAWWLMCAVAICCNLLVGYGARNLEAEPILLFILPLVISISFMLIADIDSPRGGLIRVNPQNLAALAESLHAP